MDREQVETIVRNEIALILPGSAIDRDEALRAHGLDSLRSVELTLNLEEALDTLFDDADMTMENFTSIDSIVDLVVRHHSV